MNIEFAPGYEIFPDGRVYNNKSKGINNSQAKLTKEDVLYIRDAVYNGEKQVDLSIKYKVSKACISDVVHRRTWKHL